MKIINKESVKFEKLSTRAKSAIIRMIRHELQNGTLKTEGSYNKSGKVRDCGIKTRQELLGLAENYKLTGECCWNLDKWEYYCKPIYRQV